MPGSLVPRGVDEDGGAFYFLLPECTIHDWDGGAVTTALDGLGLDVNRGFPAGWAPHMEWPGAGDNPLSDLETWALAESRVAHPSIHGA